MFYEIDDFEIDVIKRSHQIPVLVDFWADWCGPCKILGPILEKLAEANRDDWVLAKIDTEKHQSIAARYAIRSIPSVKLFVDGEVCDEFVGALPEAQLTQWLSKAVPGKYRAQLDEAKQMIQHQKTSEAVDILDIVLSSEPSNEYACILLSQAFLCSDPDRAIEVAEPINLGSDYFDVAEGIRTLARMFRYLDDTDSLPVSPVRDLYLSAIRHARSSDFGSALSGFIDVIKNGRYYDDDGARKACISIFHLLGEDHETSKRYRSDFGSALF